MKKRLDIKFEDTCVSSAYLVTGYGEPYVEIDLRYGESFNLEQDELQKLLDVLAKPSETL